jgi:integrase
MLFRVYSRYVPNLTRNDGSAMDRLLTKTFVGTSLPDAPPTPPVKPPSPPLVQPAPTPASRRGREKPIPPPKGAASDTGIDAQPPPLSWADLAQSWLGESTQVAMH